MMVKPTMWKAFAIAAAVLAKAKPLVSKIGKNTFWLDLRKNLRKQNLRKYLRKLRVEGENFSPNLNFNDKRCFHVF